MALLIVVSGLPASGKSTLSEAVSRKLAAPVFSVDPIESAILKSGVKKSFETGLAAYLVAEVQAEMHLKLGFSVVIDAVCPAIESRDMWRDLARRIGADLRVIECVCPEELHRERVERRVRNLYGFAETTWADIERLQGEYTRWEEPKCVVNTSRPDSLDVAVSYLTGRS